MVSGAALEVATFGGYTFALGFHEAAGFALLTTGLAMTSYHAQDISFEKTASFPSNTKYVPGYTQEFGWLDEKTVIWKNTEVYAPDRPLPRDENGVIWKRSSPPDPDPRAEGNPHTTIQIPGPAGQYTTHNGDGTWKQYRGSGKPHGSIPRPNVKENKNNSSPSGPRPGNPNIRNPRPEGIPAAK